MKWEYEKLKAALKEITETEYDLQTARAKAKETIDSAGWTVDEVLEAQNAELKQRGNQ